jgi:hypothetical protein
MLKVIVWIAAPAALASTLLLAASGLEPADAKGKTQTCSDHFNACDKRCMDRYGLKTEKGVQQYLSCGNRTCMPQYKNCQKTEGGSPAGTKDTGGKKGPHIGPSDKTVQPNPSPPKGGMPTPRGGTFQQSAPQGSGGGGPILRSGKR